MNDGQKRKLLESISCEGFFSAVLNSECRDEEFRSLRSELRRIIGEIEDLVGY